MFDRVDGVAGPRTLVGGTMLDDKYRIERLLATGGMGAVYLGTHTRLRKRVAIKVLNPQLSTAPMVERFHREAITASQIGHEGIAQVTDMGTSHEGEPFLVMEYLEGESLASRLRTAGRLAIDDACELGCSILEPLYAAHRAGIIHRDLKPDNVFLVRQSRGETVKLLDFGISRASGLDRQFRLTMTGLVLGTPYYMSPEQARGESEITTAADLYAFGVMLYEMLTGTVPIRADNYNQLMYRVTVGDFLPPRSQRPDLPADLERIILHAMAQEPDRRPANALELEQALLPFCRPAFCERVFARISPHGLVAAAKRGPSEPTIQTARAAARAEDPQVDDATQVVASSELSGPTLSDGERGEPCLGSGPDAAPAGSGPGGRPAAQPIEPATEPDVEVATASYPPAVRPAGPRRSPMIAILSGAAIVLIGAGAGAALVIATAGDDGPPLTRSTEPAPSPVSAAGSAATDAPLVPRVTAAITSAAALTSVEPAPTPPGAPTITLRLAIAPPEAAILLDDKPVTGTELVVPRDGARHRLRITAPGYLDFEDALAFDESQRVVVQLTRAAGHTSQTRGISRTNEMRGKRPVRGPGEAPGSRGPGDPSSPSDHDTPTTAGSTRAGEQAPERIESKSPYR